MTQGRRILVVAQSTSLASSLLTWLGDSHEIVVANTFAAAKHHLATRPDLLIAEVKLGEYNGLHLALRGGALGVPAIVLGAADEAFSRQAEQLGAQYLEADDLDAAGLREAMERAWDRPVARTEEPVQWYYGLVVRPIAVDPSIALPELRPFGPVGRGVVIH